MIEPVRVPPEEVREKYHLEQPFLSVLMRMRESIRKCALRVRSRSLHLMKKQPCYQKSRRSSFIVPDRKKRVLPGGQ